MPSPADLASFEWGNYLNNCLESTEYLCLATVDGESGVWSNPVYFSWDTHLNIYFISLPNARHMHNLIQDPRASVSIYPTNQLSQGEVFGMQAEGRAEILTTKEDISAAYALYYRRVDPKTQQSEHQPLESFLLGISAWQFVKFSPEKIYYFDTRFFDEEQQGRQEVPESVYKNNPYGKI